MHPLMLRSGSSPGADAAAIEQAYKRLIKQHHPDREGGDARRAAEINRAYRELRADARPQGPARAQSTNGIAAAQARAGSCWRCCWRLRSWRCCLLLTRAERRLPIAGASACLAGSLRGHRRADGDRATRWTSRCTSTRSTAPSRDAAAARTDQRRDGAGDASRDCHHAASQRSPSLAQLDRCAAFDDAVVQLQDRDPLRDQGPFSEIAVTGRMWSGATALSDDSLAIDGRLDRIRLRVELALAPQSAAESQQRTLALR